MARWLPSILMDSSHHQEQPHQKVYAIQPTVRKISRPQALWVAIMGIGRL